VFKIKYPYISKYQIKKTKKGLAKTTCIKLMHKRRSLIIISQIVMRRGLNYGLALLVNLVTFLNNM